MTTPEPAVSPAPDTEALRMPIGRALNDAIGSQLDGGKSLAEAVDAVLPIIAEREAGLRADLDRAHAEVERLKREGSPGVMHKVDQAFHDLAIKERDLERARVDRLDGALRSTQQGLIRMEQQRDALRVAICRAAGVDPDEVSEVDTDYEAMCAELARVSGARTIPDDAASQVAQCLSDYWIDLRGRRQDADDTEHGQAHSVMGLVRQWLAAPVVDAVPDDAAERFHVGDLVRWDGDCWFEGRIVGETAPSERYAGDEKWNVEVTVLGTMYADKPEQIGRVVHLTEERLTLLADLGATPTTGPAQRLTLAEWHAVWHVTAELGFDCTGRPDCPARLHAHGCALDPCTPPIAVGASAGTSNEQGQSVGAAPTTGLDRALAERLVQVLEHPETAPPAFDPVPEYVWQAVWPVARRAREAGQNPFWVWHSVYEALKVLGFDVQAGVPTTGPAPAAADVPMPADEKPVLAHTTGWQGVVERAALRCCDVDRRNWNLVSEADRDRYRQYGMAMVRALPPHIAGQMHEPPPASVDRCCPACAADVEKVEAESGDGIQPDPWRCTLCGWTGHEWDLAAREDTATPDGMADFDAQLRWADGPDDDCNDNLTAGFLRPSAPTEEV